MFLDKKSTGLWVVDVQEKLLEHVDRSCEVLEKICYAVEAACILKLPLFVTEQAPDKFGKTSWPIKERLPIGQIFYPKTTFSGFHSPFICDAVEKLGVKTWILVGIEAHICVLQTAKDLITANKEVVILNDAVSSRSVYNFSTAIGELRDCGCRISSTETVVYECIRDADSKMFKDLFPLIKSYG